MTQAPLLAYLLILALIIGVPLTGRSFPQFSITPQWDRRLLVGLIFGGAAVLSILRGGMIVPLALLMAIPFVGRGSERLLGGLAAIMLFAPVPWWRGGMPPGMAAPILFLLFGLGIVWLLVRAELVPAREQKGDAVSFYHIAWMLGIGCAMGLWTGPISEASSAHMAWHHWGAYLSPVHALLSGGVPFRDFPVQYGMGPTLLLSALCSGQQCWQGIYGATVAMNTAHFAVLGSCALMVMHGLPRGFRWTAMSALFVATFIWTAFPAQLASMVMTPSVGGMRFLPLAMLLLYIVQVELGGVKRDWMGHVLWMANLFWSPEAMWFGTVLWWPYLAIRDAAVVSGLGAVARVFVHKAGLGIVLLGLSLGVFALLFRAIFGDWLWVEGFFIYISHPPGPLPVNLLGPVWLLIAVIIMAILVMARLKNSADARIIFACLLALMAAASYYLSRAHDNNIINLFPFMLILLLAVMRSLKDMGQGFVRAFIYVFIASLVAYVPTVGAASFKFALIEGRIGQFGPSHLISRFAPQPSDKAPIVDQDAVRALTALRASGGGEVLLFDEQAIMPTHYAVGQWTGVNNIANFSPLPRAVVEEYIARGAKAYHRPGWLLVDNNGYGEWAQWFARSYDMDRQERFGTYTAYHFTPKNN